MTNGDYGQAGGNLLVGLLSGFMEGKEKEREREAELAEERRQEEAMIRKAKIMKGWTPETITTPAPAVEPTTLESMLLKEPVTLGRGVAGVPIAEERLRPPEKSMADIVKEIQARMKRGAWEDYQAGRATEEQKKLIGVLVKAPTAPRVTPEEKRKADYRKWMAGLATKRVGEERVGGLSEKVIASLEVIQTLPAEQAWRKFYENEAEFTTAEADIIKSGLIRLFGGMGRTKAGIVPPAEEDLPTLMERIISGLVPGQYKRR